VRYWQHDETARLLAIDLQMAPSKWTEITEEQYNKSRQGIEPNTNVLEAVPADEA
jgi:hypothetical protein